MCFDLNTLDVVWFFSRVVSWIIFTYKSFGLNKNSRRSDPHFSEYFWVVFTKMKHKCLKFPLEWNFILLAWLIVSKDNVPVYVHMERLLTSISIIKCKTVVNVSVINPFPECLCVIYAFLLASFYSSGIASIALWPRHIRISSLHC